MSLTLLRALRRRRARESIKTLSAPQPQEVRPYTSLVQPLTNARPTAAAARSSALLHQTSGPQQVTHSQNRGSAKPRGLSTMGLTPGTPFMAEIERSLEFYICQRLQRWHHLEFELSGARVQACHPSLPPCSQPPPPSPPSPPVCLAPTSTGLCSVAWSIRVCCT